VGVGACRKTDAGVMCPSYMATREEKHSTRGRAHLLWEMLQGEVLRDGWKSEEVKDALDLCLSCKACKTECPTNVDLATYKAEFLAHYYEGRPRPLHAYAFGLIDRWARMASIAPGLANSLGRLGTARAMANALLHVAPSRKLPEFAASTFRSSVRSRLTTRGASVRGEVLLWADTFTNYFQPHIAMAAFDVLSTAGFQVRVIERHVCCGRPLYDFGMLDRAKQ
jgi:Fe-S oxidoreductase